MNPKLWLMAGQSMLAGLTLLVLSGCASTADPNQDSLGFSVKRNQQERIAPLQGQLAEEQQDDAAERIRSLTLKDKISQTEAASDSREEKISRCKAQIEREQGILSDLNQQIAATQLTATEQNELIAHRNAVQNEVDRLSAILAKLLETE